MAHPALVDGPHWRWLAFAALTLGCAGAPAQVEGGSASEAEEPAAASEPEPVAPASAAASDEERTARALERLVDACRAGDVEAAAAGIVDRSPGAPPWSRAADASEPAARRAVEGVCARIVGALRGGTYERLGYEMARQGEGLWHVCPVRYAATGEEAVFAFLEVDGTLLLGDID
ncbi:MAG: hypothetical protein VYE22_18435 [Myxococcota bacterium]|nr:hypothetical protein [Myxococcota bacterium]